MMSVSADGFIEGPDRDIGWHLADDEIQRDVNLAAETDGDLALSGADLAAAFRRHDLIDGYRVYLHPVAIGRGKPLFEPVDTRTDLRLIQSRAFGNGVVLLHHRRA